MPEADCVFCRIARGEISANPIYEDDEIMAFDDLHPQAPVHFLVIPKAHIETMDDLVLDQAGLVGRMMLRAAKIAREKGVANAGYRHVVNCKGDGGQEVFHLHFHVLGGRRMDRMG